MLFQRIVGFTSCTLMIILLSNLILVPISQTSLFKVEAQTFDRYTLRDKIDQIRNNAQNIVKKLRDVPGEKIPNDYIVVLNDNNFLSSASLLAGKARSDGAIIQHVYDDALQGFSMKVPNQDVLEEIVSNPGVDYVQPDVKVKAADALSTAEKLAASRMRGR